MNNKQIETERLVELGWVPPPIGKFTDGTYLHNGQGFMVKFFPSHFELYVKIASCYLPVKNVKIRTEEDLEYYVNPISHSLQYAVTCIKGVTPFLDKKLTGKEILAAAFKRVHRTDSLAIYVKESTGERLILDELGTSWVYTVGLSERKINSIDEFNKTIIK